MVGLPLYPPPRGPMMAEASRSLADAKIDPRWEGQVDLKIQEPMFYRPGAFVVGQSEVPGNTYQMRLVVYPRGQNTFEGAFLDSLSAYLELLPPASLLGRPWTCENIRFEFTVFHQEDEKLSVTRSGTFTLSESLRYVGLAHVIELEHLLHGFDRHSGWLTQSNELCVRGRARLVPKEPRGRQERVEMSLRGLEKVSWGKALASRLAGPKCSFGIQLKACNAISEDWESLSLFIELHRGCEQEIMCGWSVPDVKCHVTVSGRAWSIRRAATFCFKDYRSVCGWSEVCPLGWITPEETTVVAEVEFPLPRDGLDGFFRAFDFCTVPEYVTFHLAEGLPMYFDKHILVQRSEYFRDMLEGCRWKESRCNEIDLTQDPQADKQSLGAIFRFMMSDTFCAHGDTMLAFRVRSLADRYRLSPLVDKVETELESMLSETNALMFLGQVFGSGSRIENLCLPLVKAHDCKILKLQREELFQVVEQNPELAKHLMDLLLELGDGPRLTRIEDLDLDL